MGQKGYTNGDASLTINTARAEKGTIKILKNVGGLYLQPIATSSNGLRILYPKGSKNNHNLYDYYTVPEGRKTQHIISDFMFQSISPQKEYFAFTIPGVYTSKPTKDGIGVFDVKSGKAWQQEGAIFGTWSKSGREFVFARYLYNGKYYLGDRWNNTNIVQAFQKQSPESRLKNTHFFVLNIEGIGKNIFSVKRISSIQSNRLVGNWFVPAFLLSVDITEPKVIRGSNVSPNNSGIVIVDHVDTHYDPKRPMLPTGIGFEYTTTYIDSKGVEHTYDASPPLAPVSWSRDGERAYCIPADAFWRPESETQSRGLTCVWIRAGKYASTSVPDEFGLGISFIED
jgi:hypothetical protein